MRIILNGERKSLTSSARYCDLIRRGGGGRIFKRAAGRLVQMDFDGVANRRQMVLEEGKWS